MLGKKFKIQGAQRLRSGRRGNPSIRALGPEGGEGDGTREKGTKVKGGLVEPLTLFSEEIAFPPQRSKPLTLPHPISCHKTGSVRGGRGQAGGPGGYGAGWKLGWGWLPGQSRPHSSPSGGLRLSGRDKLFQWFSGVLINCEAGRSPRGTDKASPALQAPGSQRLRGLNFCVVWTSSLGFAGVVCSASQRQHREANGLAAPQAAPEMREGGLSSVPFRSCRLGEERLGMSAPYP